MDDPTFRKTLRATLDDYARRWPAEAASLVPIFAQLDLPGDPRDRATLPGHVTASAFIVSDDGRRMLLVRHVGLNMWLQPGGHVDVDEAVPAAAVREAFEETGLHVEPFAPADAMTPIDVDVHEIPANARRAMPAHWHFDLRYLMRIADAAADIALATAEVDAFRWIELADELAAGATDLPRAIAKVRARVGEG